MHFYRRQITQRHRTTLFKSVVIGKVGAFLTLFAVKRKLDRIVQIKDWGPNLAWNFPSSVHLLASSVWHCHRARQCRPSRRSEQVHSSVIGSRRRRRGRGWCREGHWENSLEATLIRSKLMHEGDRTIRLSFLPFASLGSFACCNSPPYRNWLVRGTFPSYIQETFELRISFPETEFFECHIGYCR